MAQDTGQIREAIDETRAEIAETIEALGHKADVKARLNQAAIDKRDSALSWAQSIGKDPVRLGAVAAGFVLLLVLTVRRRTQ
jgi:hypothetical protein